MDPNATPAGAASPGPPAAAGAEATAAPPPRPGAAGPADAYDVVILGGAIAGASAALLLRRESPHLRVLVVEKTRAFDAKVGEATTEMSGMFFTRRLALWHHLEREQLPKEGLRYWFHNDRVRGHAEATEAGGFVRSTVPSFQLRRDALDQHVLDLAVAEGAELARPAHVREIDLRPHASRVVLDLADGTGRTLTARWVIDASGRACVVGRKLGLIERNARHPTAAIWARFRNVRHIDDVAARAGGELARRNVSSRRLATNHYVGRGYWVWVIPLGNGETSVGVVYDRRLHRLHEGGDKAARLARFLAFLRANPVLAELLEGAEPRAEDFRLYSQLAYATRQYAGEGWALVGDAAAFLDPYYSPGLDHVGFTVDATVAIVQAQLRGEDVAARVAEHNATFVRSYWRFFEAVYKDKYFYMGEADLLSAAFLLDTAQYYIFVVMPAYRAFGRFHWMPVLGPQAAFVNYHLMRLYNWRFKRIAVARQAMGEAGRRNHGRRIKAFYDLGLAPFRMALRGVRLWLAAEADMLRLQARRIASRRPAADFRDPLPVSPDAAAHAAAASRAAGAL